MASQKDPSSLEGKQRTVTKPFRGREDVEMDYIGWIIFGGLLVLMLPLLPILVILWVLAKLLGSGRPE